MPTTATKKGAASVKRSTTSTTKGAAAKAGQKAPKVVHTQPSVPRSAQTAQRAGRATKPVSAPRTVSTQGKPRAAKAAQGVGQGAKANITAPERIQVRVVKPVQPKPGDPDYLLNDDAMSTPLSREERVIFAVMGIVDFAIALVLGRASAERHLTTGLTALVLAVLSGGCLWIAFRKKETDGE